MVVGGSEGNLYMPGASWYTTNQLCRITSSINLIRMPSHLTTLSGILQRQSTNISPQTGAWHYSNSRALHIDVEVLRIVLITDVAIFHC